MFLFLFSSLDRLPWNQQNNNSGIHSTETVTSTSTKHDESEWKVQNIYYLFKLDLGK